MKDDIEKINDQNSTVEKFENFEKIEDVVTAGHFGSLSCCE